MAMKKGFIATFQYVKGGGTLLPFTGIRDASASTPATTQIGSYCDTVLSLKQPAGNAGSMVAKVIDPAFITPPSLGLLVLQAIGNTTDLAYNKFITTLIPPTPAEVLTFYRSVSLIPTGTALDLVIPRYIAASFIGGEG